MVRKPPASAATATDARMVLLPLPPHMGSAPVNGFGLREGQFGPWFDTEAVRRGPAGRSSPEASQRCAAGAGLDGADQAQAILVPSNPHAIQLCHPIPCHKPAPASRS